MGETLAYLLIGALMGMVGQLLRVVVGIKKEMEEANPQGMTVRDWFNFKELVVTILLGGGAGVLAAASDIDPDIVISKELLFGFMAAGYAGSDFVGGFMGKWIK